MYITNLKWEKEWNKALILWWIHWNEKSGNIAIKKFLENINNQTITLLSWEITLISECNEKAWKENCKFIEDNLNRCFYEWQNLDSQEWIIAKKIMPFFKKPGYSLDLHSTSWESIPFLISKTKNIEFAQKLWISYIISWWNNLWISWLDWNTISYMNSKWGEGFVLESWNHDNLEWPNNAYQVLLNFLSNLWIINSNLFKKLENKTQHIKLNTAYVCKTWNFKFMLNKSKLENVSLIKSWTLIWLDWDEEIIVERDVILVMPNLAYPKKWEEVFFIWEKINN